MVPCRDWRSVSGAFPVFLAVAAEAEVMRVEVLFESSRIPEPRRGERELFVVVDLLRTSTTVCVALAQGARAIVPFATPEQAREFARTSVEPVLLAGEQGGRRIEGFALENSPLEYRREQVAGRVIAFVSTNGTPLVRRLPDGEEARTVVMGLVNRAAVVEYCRLWEPECVYVCCAGHRGAVAYEDVVGAGALVAGLQGMRSVKLTDAAHVALVVYREAIAEPVAALLRASHHARFLALEGKRADVEYAVQQDLFWLVPRWYQGRLIAAAEFSSRTVQRQTTTPECAA